MSAYRLLENAFAAPTLGSVFHGAAFHRLHAPDGGGAYFEWLSGDTVVASIHFTQTAAGHWRSPARGTFGGFACAPGLRLDALFEFHDAVLARLAQLGAATVEILPPPMAHDAAAFSNQMYVMATRGYAITQHDLNHTLEVDPRGLDERMSYGNLKRLRKCEREGLTARPLPQHALAAVYDTLAANRAAKGHELSMSLAQLERMAAQLPGVMHLFGCGDVGSLAAAALCLRLDRDTLYVFYWGDRPGYATLSPVVPLAVAIYAHCQAEGIRLLDVGTSTIGPQPNLGLIQFKRSLGFSESLKLRMTRHLHPLDSPIERTT